VLWFLFYHPPSYTQLHGAKSSKIAELKKIDWIGVVLLTAGLALFLVGISWGGPTQPWSSPKILGLLISGAVAVVSFILYESLLTPAQPIVPMHFFRDMRGFTCLEIISSTYGIINIALFVMWPQQVTYIFGSTVSTWQESAWLSTTAAFGLWGGIVVLGPLMSWIGHIRYQILVSSVWMTAFLGAMASITVEKKSMAIAFSFLAGWTIGWGEVIAAIIVQYVVEDHELGVAFCKWIELNIFAMPTDILQPSYPRRERFSDRFLRRLSSRFIRTKSRAISHPSCPGVFWLLDYPSLRLTRS
jgi:hypothetical protein